MTLKIWKFRQYQLQCDSAVDLSTKKACQHLKFFRPLPPKNTREFLEFCHLSHLGFWFESAVSNLSCFYPLTGTNPAARCCHIYLKRRCCVLTSSKCRPVISDREVPCRTIGLAWLSVSPFSLGWDSPTPCNPYLDSPKSLAQSLPFRIYWHRSNGIGGANHPRNHTSFPSTKVTQICARGRSCWGHAPQNLAKSSPTWSQNQSKFIKINKKKQLPFTPPLR